jgi:hypothetical protein
VRNRRGKNEIMKEGKRKIIRRNGGTKNQGRRRMEVEMGRE